MQEKHFVRGINDLKEWMKTNKINQTELSKMLECTFSTLWHWLSGIRIPSLEAAAKIEVLTKGKVKCVAWTIPVEENKRTTAKGKKPVQTQSSRSNKKGR